MASRLELRCALLSLGAFFVACMNPASAANPPADASKYTGPGSCSSTSCHGSVKPRTDNRIFQNEYSIWAVKDKHAKAYDALTGPVGERMAKILGLGKSEQAAKCLACHALDVPAEARAKTFELNEGVSCENCHGPASAWLGPHTTRTWTHEQSVAAGMYDTRNLVRRTEKCLTCHLGTQEKFVDHEMIAAGHPDLYFELDSFSAVMPRHWKTPRESAPGVPAEKDAAWNGVREWGTGQAVQLRASMQRVAWRAKGKNWPEYSELQCFSCHHSLTAPEQSWRQERGYAGRRPGNPPWNGSRYAIFREFAHQLDNDAATRLDDQVAQLSKSLSQLNPDRDAVASTSAAAATLANQLATRIEAQPYDAAMTLRLLQHISDDADEISNQGERAAEQAAMALDSLFIAYSRTEKVANTTEIRAAINSLFQQLENPSNYNPADFARQMRKVGSLLR
ncbi:MAG TPA: multiheme c-type cytochrome [Candidatus Acidoferrales bacterium]|nr:multiheme c-type cytochrome [Candidatus Acidoferrales bacterium]